MQKHRPPATLERPVMACYLWSDCSNKVVEGSIGVQISSRSSSSDSIASSMLIALLMGSLKNVYVMDIGMTV